MKRIYNGIRLIKLRQNNKNKIKQIIRILIKNLVIQKILRYLDSEPTLYWIVIEYRVYQVVLPLRKQF